MEEARTTTPNPLPEDATAVPRGVEELLLSCLALPEEEWAGAVERACVDHPARAEEIRARFRVLQGLGMTPLSTDSSRMPGTGERFGDFTLLRILGRGGMGVVFLARQESMQRQVALKLIRPELLHLPHAKERFRREVEVASQFEDPGICTVYGAGETDGTPWIAMRYVEGDSLAARIETSAGPADRARIHEILDWGERLARSVHKAHEAGMIHRDIKPGNIVITREGQPVLLDFGLARPAADEENRLTLSGEVVGTPAYMSPEQVSSRGLQLDRRTDIYSLGATLYECVTRRCPFAASTREELYRQVLTGDAPDCRLLNRAVPKDLQTVLATAMERDRERRYATALDFAEDLRRVRNLEPIHAKPASALLRTKRWMQRNPVLATFVLCLCAALGVALYQLDRIGTQKEQIQTQSAEIQRQSKRNRLLAIVGAAEKELTLSPAAALKLGTTAALLQGELGIPEVLSVVNSAIAQSHEITSFGPYPNSMLGADVTRDGTHFLTRSDFACLIWGPKTGKPTIIQGRATERVLYRSAQFAPEGDRVIAGFTDGFVRVYDLGGELQLEFRASQTHPINAATFSPDGQTIGTVSGDGHGGLWARDGTRQLHDLPGHVGIGLRARFSPDGKVFATGDTHGSVLLWDSASAVQLHRLVHRRGPKVGGIRRIDWSPSPDVPLLVTVQVGAPARLWNTTNGELVAELGDGEAVDCAFCGDRIVVGGYDGIVRVFDRDGRLVLGLNGHDAFVIAVAATSDGRMFASASNDNTVRVWDRSGRTLQVLYGHTAGVEAVAFFPDGKTLLTCGDDRIIRLWRIGDAALPVLHGHEHAVLGVCWSADGRLLTWSSDDTARTWDPSGRQLSELRHDDIVCGAAFLPDGLIATATENGVVRIWTGDREAQPFPFPRSMVSALVAIPGRCELYAAIQSRQDLRYRLMRFTLVGGSWSRTEVTTSTALHYLGLAASQDGRHLLVGGSDRKASVVDLQGRVLQQLEPIHQKGVRGVAFSPDGALLATASVDTSARLWDRATGECLRVLGGHRGALTGCEFSPDGTLLATSSVDGTAKLWSVAEGALVATLHGHRGPVWGVTFSPDGKRLYTCGADRTVRTWIVDRDELLRLAIERTPEFHPAEVERYAPLLGDDLDRLEGARRDLQAGLPPGSSWPR